MATNTHKGIIYGAGISYRGTAFNFTRDYYDTYADLEAEKKNWNIYFPKYFITNVGGVLYQYDGTTFNKFLESGGKYASAEDLKLLQQTHVADQKANEEQIGAINIQIQALDSKVSTKADNKNATTSVAGLMSAADKAKLDGIAEEANKYSLPQATKTALGGIKTDANVSGKNYAVQLDSTGAAYVNVPWTDNNTTYSDMTGATANAAGTHGLVPAPAAGKQASFLRGDGTWVVPTDTNTTYSVAHDGSSEDTVKLIPNSGLSTSITINNVKQAENATSAANAANAAKVSNALTIKGLTSSGTLDTGQSYNGSAAVSFEAITFTEIEAVING